MTQLDIEVLPDSEATWDDAPIADDPRGAVPAELHPTPGLSLRERNRAVWRRHALRRLREREPSRL